MQGIGGDFNDSPDDNDWYLPTDAQTPLEGLDKDGKRKKKEMPNHTRIDMNAEDIPNLKTNQGKQAMAQLMIGGGPYSGGGTGGPGMNLDGTGQTWIKKEATAPKKRIPSIATASSSSSDSESEPILHKPKPKKPAQSKKKKYSFLESLRDSSDDGEMPVFAQNAPLTNPNFLVVVALIMFLGIRPRRLQKQLRKYPAVIVWKALRDSIMKRWTTLAVVSGLMISASATMAVQPSQLDQDQRVAYVLAMAGRSSALVACLFSIGLGLCFADASPKDFARLARRPIEMVILLSSPSFFAISAVILIYASLVASVWSVDFLAARIVVTTLGGTGLLIILYFSIMAYQLSDETKAT